LNASLNPSGVSSLRAFTVVRREVDASGKDHLLGRLSGTEPSSPHLNCLIGLHGSWVWFNEFGIADGDGLVSVPADSSDALKEDDNILYLLPSEFQPPIAFILLDPQQNWDERTFGPGLAASSRIIGTDAQYWRRTRPIHDASELEVDESLVVDGWDHEHCSVCNKHIVQGQRYFFKAWGNRGSFLCVFCHNRFAKTHSIGDVIYPGEGERADEEG
jgi:hypothetical protein